MKSHNFHKLTTSALDSDFLIQMLRGGSWFAPPPFGIKNGDQEYFSSQHISKHHKTFLVLLNFSDWLGGNSKALITSLNQIPSYSYRIYIFQSFLIAIYGYVYINNISVSVYSVSEKLNFGGKRWLSVELRDFRFFISYVLYILRIRIAGMVYILLVR